MTKKELIQEYINGWKQGNVDKILNVLIEDCIIIESDSSKYNGKNDILKWINDWIFKNNTVNRWDIVSFYEDKDTAFIEWVFECTVEKEKHNIEGISLVKFENNKICFIREYRTV